MVGLLISTQILKDETLLRGIPERHPQQQIMATSRLSSFLKQFQESRFPFEELNTQADLPPASFSKQQNGIDDQDTFDKDI